MGSSTEYYDNTFNSKNPLRRFAQRKRINKSMGLLQFRDGLKILDYGCGDGLFLNMIKRERKETMDLTGYDPYMDTLPANEVFIARTKNELGDNPRFDYITCFEAMEHMGDAMQDATFEHILSMLDADGTLILSVPIESGFPALVKNPMRWRFYWKKDKKWFINVVKSVFSLPIPEYSRTDDYIPLHMGFYFKDFENKIKKKFTIKNKFFSPFPVLGSNFNSQVFYICQPL